jgi:Arc/MetJ-type ribon-helix-helix transcriptional regulator
MFTGGKMISVNVRVPEELIKSLDSWVDEGRFASRSDAVKTILAFYKEREKTRSFLALLDKRSREARENPDILVPLD